MIDFKENIMVVKRKMSGIDLSEKEVAVYATLVEIGGAFPSRISELAGLNRSTTYSILTSLAIKGLVSEIKRNNKIYYQIEKASNLLKYSKDRIKMAENRYKKTLKIIPELEGLISLTPNKPKIRFFEGSSEIFMVYEDHVDVTKKYEMLAWSNAGQIGKIMPKKLKQHYLVTKDRLGIKLRAIVPNSHDNLVYNDVVYKNVSKAIVPNLRFVDADDFPYMSEITIYGVDKVSIVNFNKETPVGVVIENQTIHDMMKMIFELSWNSSCVKRAV